MRTPKSGELPTREVRPAPARPTLEFVRKRDGRVVPYQRAKIAEAVGRALEAAGEADARFAGEVAAIVELSLLERVRAAREPAGEAATPSIETIQDLVERALMELGRASVAKAYILHRDLRARLRAALRVHRSDSLRAPVRVREREGISDWSKGRIVAALMQEAELPREQAEDVASAVERRVFAAAKKTVTTGLIRELVASELFERGWTAALSASRVVGLARLDVRRALAGQALHPWSSEALTSVGRTSRLERPGVRLAGEVLARYALASVLPEALGELHRAGDLHVVGLESLDRVLTLSAEAELLSPARASPTGAYELLGVLAELAPHVAHGIVLERPAALFSPLVRSARETSFHGLSAWLRALTALAQGARVQIDFGPSGARSPAASARVVEELGELEGSLTPRFFLDGPELEAVLGARADLAPTVERLLAAGRLIPVFGGSEGGFAGPGSERREGERGAVACAGAIALNLPRIARRVGPFREELFQSALAELVQAALEIARALRPLQERVLPGLRARTSYALVPVGLREALLVLGDGALDCALAARVLGFLGEAARRFAPAGELEPTPTPFFGELPAARFAYLDARSQRAEGARQEWLFGEAEGESRELRAYSSGFALFPAGTLPPGRAEAEALRAVSCGVIPLNRAAASQRGWLDVVRRFEAVRRAHALEPLLELFPRPREDRPAPRLRPLV